MWEAENNTKKEVQREEEFCCGPREGLRRRTRKSIGKCAVIYAASGTGQSPVAFPKQVTV